MTSSWVTRGVTNGLAVSARSTDGYLLLTANSILQTRRCDQISNPSYYSQRWAMYTVVLAVLTINYPNSLGLNCLNTWIVIYRILASLNDTIIKMQSWSCDHYSITFTHGIYELVHWICISMQACCIVIIFIITNITVSTIVITLLSLSGLTTIHSNTYADRVCMHCDLITELHNTGVLRDAVSNTAMCEKNAQLQT